MIIVFTTACANSRYMRQSADQHPWVHAWRVEELNPRAKAKGFLGSGPVISTAPGWEVRIPAPTHKGLYTKLSTIQWMGRARSSTERVIAAVRLGRPRQDGIQDEPERTASRCQRNVFHLRRLLDTLRADEAPVVLVGDQHPLECVQVLQHPLFRFVLIIGNSLRDFQEDPGRAWAVLLMRLAARHRIQPIDTEVVGLFHLDRTLDAL